VTARLVCAALCFAFIDAARAGWREEVAALRAGEFAPPADLTARYVFGWGGIEAAAADVQLRREGAVWKAMVRGGTTGAARRLWQLDADYEAVTQSEDWRSLSSFLAERYRRYRVEEVCEFRGGGVRSLRWNTKADAGKPEWMNFYVPGLRDMAGAMLLARSQPLNDGDLLHLAVFPGEWMYLVRAKVEGRESLPWQGEQRKVIRLSLDIDWIGKDFTLQPHRKFKRGTVWVSDDEVRMPLRIEVKVFVGAVFAELQSLKMH